MKKNGFTLLEVIFASTIMITAIVAVLALLQQAVAFLPFARERLVASYLGQEGIEIVRNLRDNNKLQRLAWNQGLTGCALGCEADYLSSGLVADSGRYLQVSSGFYQYAAGTPTVFKRKITLTSIDADSLKVSAEVSWSEKGRSHSLKVQENLFNW